MASKKWSVVLCAVRPTIGSVLVWAKEKLATLSATNALLAQSADNLIMWVYTLISHSHTHTHSLIHTLINSLTHTHTHIPTHSYTHLVSHSQYIHSITVSSLHHTYTCTSVSFFPHTLSVVQDTSLPSDLCLSLDSVLNFLRKMKTEVVPKQTLWVCVLHQVVLAVDWASH